MVRKESIKLFYEWQSIINEKLLIIQCKKEIRSEKNFEKLQEAIQRGFNISAKTKSLSDVYYLCLAKINSQLD